MITSNINEILIKNQIENKINNKTTNNEFVDTLIADKKNHTQTAKLTYENIKSVSLEQIEILFEDEDKKSLAKNLKLATMFSTDDNLSKALFNTVMGKPFDLGYSYLFDMYEDKSSYLNSSKTSLASLLQKSISTKLDDGDKKITDKISQTKLNEILTVVNSFNFVEALSTGYKDLNDRYKDEDDQYAFLYNDFYLKYQELEYKYNEQKNKNNSLLNQFK
ncbi:MAG: hypothetical protein ACNI25_06985 [Halarcobacter sp.]